MDASANTCIYNLKVVLERDRVEKAYVTYVLYNISSCGSTDIDVNPH